MRKIYSKFTKERDLKFQIETAIYEDQESNRIVIKSPLNSEAVNHILRMFENYQYFLNNHIDMLLPCKMNGNSVSFPYLKGKSLYSQMLNAAQEKNKSAILELFGEYMEIIHLLYPETYTFKKSEQFVEVFGDIDFTVETMASKKIDVDLTFDNIVYTEDGIRILDYEWIFDFDIPLKFPVYRAIYALFVKNANDLIEVISDEELYQIAEISKEERDQFAQMNSRFMEYVEGNENSYVHILEAYKQPEITDSLQDYAQVYWACNGHYSDKRVINYEAPLKEVIQLVICVDEFEEADFIRIDPTNWASMIRVIRFEVETDTEVTNLSEDEYTVEAWKLSDGYWIFESKDPQIIIPIQREKKWKKLRLEYKIEYTRLENMSLLFSKMQVYCQREIKKWQDKAREKQELSEGQAQLLNECSHTISSYEEIIQLQKDKLAYIESTKAYQTLIKSKVDSIHLWDKLKK